MFSKKALRTRQAFFMSSLISGSRSRAHIDVHSTNLVVKIIQNCHVWPCYLCVCPCISISVSQGEFSTFRNSLQSITETLIIPHLKLVYRECARIVLICAGHDVTVSPLKPLKGKTASHTLLDFVRNSARMDILLMHITCKIELSSINLKVIRDVRIMGRACNHSLQKPSGCWKRKEFFFYAPHHPTKLLESVSYHMNFVVQNFSDVRAHQWNAYVFEKSFQS